MFYNNIQYLTQQGYNDLEAELKRLKDVKIPETAKRIDEAKQQGDLSENAEYHHAREEMDEFHARLAQINYILDNAEILSKSDGHNAVNLGSIVRFEDPKGNEKEYVIVGPQEADPIAGKISNESPIGRAFLGAKVDDKIKVHTPAGVNEYKILQIS